MKKLLMLGLLAVTPLAYGQVCEQSFSMKVTYAGEPVGNNKLTYFGMPKVDATDNSKKGKKVLDVAGKVQDKGGKYAAEFLEEVTCDGVKQQAVPVLVEGVTIDGMSKILRAGMKVQDELIKKGEKAAKEGKKRAWGKE